MNQQNAYKNNSQNFLWQFHSDNKIQMWPSGDSQRYITKPTKLFPKESIERGKILVPPRNPIDITRQTGILASAVSRHNADYFVSHMGEEFITYIVMLSGVYCAKAAGKSYEIKAGDCFVLPANMPCDYFTRKRRFNLIWFHIKNSAEWRNICGGAPTLRKMALGGEFATLYQMYADELYGQTQSITFLQNALGLIVEILKRQFAPAEISGKARTLKPLLAEINADLSRAWTAEGAAKKISLTVPRLNALFVDTYGKTFAKYLLEIKMAAAVKMISQGRKLAHIAQRTGFSTPYALSNTFKKYFGVSPKNYARKK